MNYLYKLDVQVSTIEQSSYSWNRAFVVAFVGASSILNAINSVDKHLGNLNYNVDRITAAIEVDPTTFSDIEDGGFPNQEEAKKTMRNEEVWVMDFWGC